MPLNGPETAIGARQGFLVHKNREVERRLLGLRNASTDAGNAFVGYLTRRSRNENMVGKMHIISHKAFKGFVLVYADAAIPLDTWYRVAKSATWNNIHDVRQTYNSADPVDAYTVFNIKGNDYRLIVIIDYQYHKIFIKNFLTHADYDKGTWKK